MSHGLAGKSFSPGRKLHIFQVRDFEVHSPEEFCEHESIIACLLSAEAPKRPVYEPPAAGNSPAADNQT